MAAAGAGAVEELAVAIRESGLVAPRSSGVVLVSGGADSACAAAGLAEVCGSANVGAITLNYGLRESADADEAVCRDLCARLGIDLEVVRPELGEGNVQAAARDARYAAAERWRARHHADWIATDTRGRISPRRSSTASRSRRAGERSSGCRRAAAG